MPVWFSSLIIIAIYVSTTFFGVALGDTSCGAACAVQITQNTTCGNVRNIRCMCQDYDYATQYRGCIQRNCTQDNLQLVFRADGQACGALGISMTEPGPVLTPQPPLPRPNPTTNLPARPDNTNTGTGSSGDGNTGGPGLLGTNSAGSSITVGKGFSLVTTLGVVTLVVL
ncbi:BZ3500_MvSof-1268-A1-R1_Chr7-1g09250 [Microbotryum saponariae]|uniref:BZ3500_MvSof-1268-A1-R1_Chr7-1g09250 protein n=1 Tax=Microbotryum saponariae TaxID=289078 RepID=A0A2X0NDE0_9BASI|nr:BZ3501_MvSof-1269-A2-R1_Chr7-1g08955 [Microbotryum saponariae]SDA03087.1 BZ3500_MvSof-1268-A1-R1_Chr7-1g09250 [Microbotryum saponariae]